jgi:hypothetical protein
MHPLAPYTQSRDLDNQRLIRKECDMISNRLRWAIGIVVGFLAIIGVGASATFYFRPLLHPRFLDYPTIVALHVILGGLYLTFAPFQFVKRIRSRWLGYHRWVGRLLVAIGLVVGAAGLFMAWVIPFAGWPERLILGFFGLLFLVSLAKGYLHIRAHRQQLHREWMLRAFAVGLAIATTRLIQIPALIVLSMIGDGELTQQQIELVVIVGFTLAFSLHALVAEVWIRVSRRKRAPAATTAQPRARGQVDMVG